MCEPLPFPSPSPPATLGIILAGGLARRMGGGDKGLRLLAGRPLLQHVIERLAPQCDGLILNANGDPARFASFGLPIVPDSLPDAPGPLAGLLAALDWAALNRPGITFVATTPVDCPFLPGDFVSRLHAACAEAGAALALSRSGGRTHPVNGLWPVSLRQDLRRALVEEDLRRVHAWASRHGPAIAEWPASPVDPFFNANTPDDLAEAERLLEHDPEKWEPVFRRDHAHSKT